MSDIQEVIIRLSDVVDALFRLLEKFSVHPIIGGFVFFIGLLTIGAFMLWLVNRYYYQVLLYAAFLFVPNVIILFMISVATQLPFYAMFYLWLFGIVVCFPYVRIQYESLQAFKEKKDPPYRWTIVTVGVLSIGLTLFLLYEFTDINTLYVIGDALDALRSRVGL